MTRGSPLVRFESLPWPLKEPPLPLLAFFGRCRLITEFVDLLVSQVTSLGRIVWASLSHWRRSRAFLKLISDIGLKLDN
jgi:hypothetical protein